MINKITKFTFNKIKKEKIHGYIKCNIGNLSFNIMNKDVIGGIIEEWVGIWLLQNKIAHYKIGTTQTFPDLVLGVPSDITKCQYLEIKCFNISKSPSFDLGDIIKIKQKIKEDSKVINTAYMIFGYTMNHDFIFVNKIWIKNIWQITGPSHKYPCKVSTLNGKPYKIKPVTWYNTKSKFKPFNSKYQFLKSIENMQ